MRGWITLTLRHNEGAVYVQVAHISAIAADARGSTVSFIGGEEDFISVTETPERIMELIGEAT